MVKFPKAYYQDSKFKSAKSKIIASRSALKIRASDSTTIEESLQTNRVSDVQKAEQTVDAEHDQTLVQRLDYETWLPAAAKVYKISPRIEDYILVSTVVCPSDVPNRNGIAFPGQELARFMPPPMNRMVYKAWTGCPVHREHDNEDHEKAYGVILDTTLTRVQGYGQGKVWKVMGLLAIDKNKYPDIALRVLNGDVNTYSMGAMVECFRCGYCGTECYICPETERHIGCHHISSIRNVNWGIQKGMDGQDHLTFLNAYGISPIECSIVEDPAWAPALSDTVWEHTPTEPDVKRVVRNGERPPVTPDRGAPTGPSAQFLNDVYKLKW